MVYSEGKRMEVEGQGWDGEIGRVKNGMGEVREGGKEGKGNGRGQKGRAP